MIARPFVVCVSATPSTILADYTRLIELTGMQFMPLASLTLLVSVGRQLPFPAHSCPPWQLEGVAQTLLNLGYTNIAYALTHTDPTDLHGYARIAQRLRLTLPRLPTQQQIALFPLQRTKTQYPTDQTLVVVDATMVGNGPIGSASIPEVGNLLLASTNASAISQVCAALLCEGPWPQAIEIIGDTEAADQRWPPYPPDPRAWIAPWQQLSQWPQRDRERYTSWLYNTGWGRLFASYHNPT